ncbi:MAG: hypothetical protein EP347_01575 [Alphaproteobacteria bacterium]|nr:MAG: hypothetical protein EP347_01575 [Alphaproteobacteria bacterium]
MKILTNSRSCAVAVLVGASVLLAGCGGGKLWGKEERYKAAQDVPKETLRELAAKTAEPVWEFKEQGSLMGRIAGVLISGEEEADTATAAFDLSGQDRESAEVALRYLESLDENNKGIDELASRVTKDAKKKNRQISKFIRRAQVDLNTRLDQRDKAVFSANKDRYPSLKKVMAEADNDRRAVAQVEKAVFNQLGVFMATRDLLAGQNAGIDMVELDLTLNEIDQQLTYLTDLVHAFRFNDGS